MKNKKVWIIITILILLFGCFYLFFSQSKKDKTKKNETNKISSNTNKTKNSESDKNNKKIGGYYLVMTGLDGNKTLETTDQAKIKELLKKIEEGNHIKLDPLSSYIMTHDIEIYLDGKKYKTYAYRKNTDSDGTIFTDTEKIKINYTFK